MVRSGFSLVELSIVLVILGLLTGGVLTGQNLIRAAELRSVITEFKNYQTAAMTFRDKYFALPGDMTNATDFWGSAGGSGELGDGCEAGASSGTATCNSDGNGKVESRGVSAASEFNEPFMFWQHLANAGIVEGSYSGKASAGGINHHTINVNGPAAKLGNAGWTSIYWEPAVNHFQVGASNSLYIGAGTTTGGTFGAIFKPEEAWNIDVKLDDGMPGSGKITSGAFATCTEAATNTEFTAPYALTTSTVSCFLVFHNSY